MEINNLRVSKNLMAEENPEQSSQAVQEETTIESKAVSAAETAPNSEAAAVP